MEQALLAALGVLAGALVWFVKAMFRRMDKVAEQRDQQIERALVSFETAVSAFSEHKEADDRVHAAMVNSQERILEELIAIRQKVEPPAAAG